MINPGSCSRGLRSRPFSAAGNNRSKGLEVHNTNSNRLAVISPSTASTRLAMAKSSCLESTEMAKVQPVSMKTHNNKEPSWPPHTAASLNCKGNKVLEFWATYSTEKSLS